MPDADSLISAVNAIRMAVELQKEETNILAIAKLCDELKMHEIAADLGLVCVKLRRAHTKLAEGSMEDYERYQKSV